MAKLFKTISLEDRLRASSYNSLPHTQREVVQQGSINLQEPRKVKDLEAAQLKLTPKDLEVKSQILKTTLSSSRLKTLPTIKLVDSKPLSSLARPFVNTKYRSSISLENRLKQSNVGSTNHLAQFFLSDVYTDYIKIKPFGVYYHTSTIILDQIQNNLNQGGQNPVLINFNSLIAQGTSLINGTYQSLVKIKIPLIDSLILQGAVFANGKYESRITITNSKLPRLINQGSGTNPTLVKSIALLEGAQGIITKYGIRQSGISIILSTPALTLPKIPTNIIIKAFIANPKQGEVKPSLITFIPKQGGITPNRITFKPSTKGPVLKVLRYAADRAIAFFTPRIKHGSADLPKNGGDFQNDDPTGDVFFNNPILYASIKIQLKKLREGQSYKKDSGRVIDSTLETYIDSLELSDDVQNSKFAIQYVGVGDKWVVMNKYITVLDIKDTGGSSSNQLKVLEQEKPDEKLFGISSKTANLLAAPELPSLESYNTLTYGQIKERAKNSSSSTKGSSLLPDFRESLSRAVYIDNINSSNYIGANSTVEGRSPANQYQPVNNDFIDLKIASARTSNGGTVTFRAFLTSFSDNFNVSWSDINYTGRQDTLKAFKGSTRGASVAFKVAAFTAADMDTIYGLLNELVRIAAVGAPASKLNYIVGPVCKITIGKWFVNTACVFNSIKYDVQVADYSWDLDVQRPQIVDVSLDFVILGDVNGNPLNAANNSYFGGGVRKVPQTPRQKAQEKAKETEKNKTTQPDVPVTPPPQPKQEEQPVEEYVRYNTYSSGDNFGSSFARRS